MAKVISQETFDDVVKENVAEFSMEPKEAKEETIKQFEAQGVNLENIIKDLTLNEKTGQPVINETISQLKCHSSKESILETSALVGALEVLESECNKSIPHRVLASNLDAHKTVLIILQEELSHNNLDKDIIHKALLCLIALTSKHPDIFDSESLMLAESILSAQQDPLIINDVLQWLAKSCVMHEMNRQAIMGSKIIEKLAPQFTSKNIEVLRSICTLFRNLVLDDDIRVEFGHAHEHGKILASSYIVTLVKLLEEFEEKTIICDLLLTIASLIVRHEFCIAVENAGGLVSVLNLLEKHVSSVKVCGESLKLLRALGGEDNVKKHIVEQGAVPKITNVLNFHKANETLAKVALLCISTLTLRVKDNSLAFFDAGAADVIVETMRLHSTSKAVQRNAAWAIRNMVSRCRERSDCFLSCGAEDLLNSAMQEHPSILQDVKAALRDLDCKVELKEEWTGKSEIKIAN